MILLLGVAAALLGLVAGVVVELWFRDRLETVEGESCPCPNTHPFGFAVLAFVFSLMWLRVNAEPVFPLGFVFALALAVMHSDIEERLYGYNHFVWMLIVSIIGSIIGFFL